MFKCGQCPSTFTVKRSLTAHQRNQDGVRFPCTICASTFSFKTHLNRHLKNLHGVARARPQRGVIEVEPNIVVPDLAAGPSNQNVNNRLNEYFNDGNDEMLAGVLENYHDDTAVERARPQRGAIEVASNIVVPAGPSNQNVNNRLDEYFNDGYDEMLEEVSENCQSSVPAHRQPVTPIVVQPERQSVKQFAPSSTPHGHIQIFPGRVLPNTIEPQQLSRIRRFHWPV